MASKTRFFTLRAQFIEAAIVEYGVITREMICGTFGVAAVTASRDLLAYRERNGGLIYNNSLKQWERASDFKLTPGLLHMQADSLLLRIEQLFKVKIMPVAVRVRMGVKQVKGDA
jgi:hypothetical protein